MGSVGEASETSAKLELDLSQPLIFFYIFKIPFDLLVRSFPIAPHYFVHVFAQHDAIMGCSSSKNALPESVDFFFNGEKMEPKAEKMMSEYFADSHVLSFIGLYAPPVPPLDKEHLGGAMTSLITSFPDFTFNFTKVKPKKMPDGGWAADIIVMGTHTGAAFTPIPGKLPPVEKTGKQVKIGPETFTLYCDADGKITKTTIRPLSAGAPAGPPGFYTEIGGQIPWSPSPEALFSRVTKIPIKSGTMKDIVKVFTTDAEFKKTVDSFDGFVGVECFQVDDTTLMAHSRWESQEATDAGAAALGKVLKGHLGPFLAGPPDKPWVGPQSMILDCGTSGTPAAYRVVIMKLQDNKEGDILRFASSKLPEFKAIDGLINVTSFMAEENQAVVLAGYTSKDKLDAATPKIGAIMKEMGQFMAGPPTSFLTEVRWSTFD